MICEDKNCICPWRENHLLPRASLISANVIPHVQALLGRHFFRGDAGDELRHTDVAREAFDIVADLRACIGAKQNHYLLRVA